MRLLAPVKLHKFRTMFYSQYIIFNKQRDIILKCFVECISFEQFLKLNQVYELHSLY